MVVGGWGVEMDLEYLNCSVVASAFAGDILLQVRIGVVAVDCSSNGDSVRALVLRRIADGCLSWVPHDT